jgi:hypothetical protein
MTNLYYFGILPEDRNLGSHIVADILVRLKSQGPRQKRKHTIKSTWQRIGFALKSENKTPNVPNKTQKMSRPNAALMADWFGTAKAT